MAKRASALLDTRVIYCGDNLEQLRRMPDACVDLVYIDPPFNSNRNYEVFWGETKEKRSFDDRHESTQAYIEFMRPRCVELARVLKPTGSFYYHCDWHAAHYVKVMLDQILGENNFVNEIIWKRQSAHNDAKQGSKHLGRVHDSLFLYAGGPKYTFNHLYRPYDQTYVDAFYRHVEKGTGRRYRLGDITAPGGAAPSKGNPHYEFLGVTRYWRYSKENMQKLYVDSQTMSALLFDARLTQLAMTGYTKLFSSIVTSTIWSEPDHVRLVWITLLAIANRHGVAEASLPGLAKLASVTLKQCEDAVHKLAGPDKYSRTKDFDGRRIQEIDGGWQLINHEKYRAKMGTDERREYNRVKQAERRTRVSMTVNDISCASALSAHTDTDTDTDTEKNKPVRRAVRAEPGEPTDFETFWRLYPNRKGKQAALRTWRKLNPDADLVGVMSSALVWQIRQPQWTKDGGQYVPMLSTWLHGRRWEDEVTQIRTGVAHNGQQAGAWRDECDKLHGGQCGNAHFHAAKMDSK